MTLLERLDRHAAETPDRVALREIATGRTMTFRQLAEATRTAPAAGRMLLCPNTCDYHIAFLSALRAGRIVFPVSPDVARRELDALVTRTTDLPDDGAAVLLQSSGTTGLPKIVRREAASIDAVAANMVEAIGFEPCDHVLACVPLCHSYGLEHGLLAPIWAGATVHLANGFAIDVVRRELAGGTITIFPAVPSVFEMLANLHDPQVRFPSLRLAYSAGGPLPPSIFERVRDHCDVVVGQLYGATEIGSITFAHPSDSHFDAASVGRPMRNVDLKLDHDRQLLVRASSMMSGYVGDDSTLTADGSFPTGDLARIDEQQNLFISGRLKLLIDVGGLKVNPLEVEQTMCEHPAVAACVVVPVRLSETVFRLKAVLTAADPRHAPSAESLRQFARQRLSSHKVPRVFEIRSTLPRSASGKVLRHLLTETP